MPRTCQVTPIPLPRLDSHVARPQALQQISAPPIIALQNVEARERRLVRSQEATFRERERDCAFLRMHLITYILSW